jgi:methylated-DNA-protein-cysteine methyltransferase-like protein
VSLNTARMADNLYIRIYEQVRLIPYGKVTSYGAIAKQAGAFRGARLVGWALKALPASSDIPWQRVVNRKGVISIVNPQIPPSAQQQVLESEGVGIEEKDGELVVGASYWWNPEL